MPTIRLDYSIHKKLILSDGVNRPLEIAKTRLQMRVLLANHPKPLNAIIDTGTPYSIVSKQLWDSPGIHDQIEWLLFPPGVKTLALPTLTLGGKVYPYRLGRLRMQPCDVSGEAWNAVSPTCQLLEDEQLPNQPSFTPQILIGLTDSLLDQLYLVVKPSSFDGRHEAWLTDERPGHP
ncbi:MAG TPA: hypothetical protein VG097_13485 [Gemmata sp.]|jgi:hypothetical protein|nr:hypothetical protein [Gemmata sp.]